MKIYFTEQFKKDLSIPYKHLELTTFKLRSGGNNDDQIYLIKNSIKGIENSEYLMKNTVPSDEYSEENYKLTGIQENKAIQLYFQIDPNENAQYVDNNTKYQLILVFYKDLTSLESDTEKLAFLLFNNFQIITSGNLYRIEFSDLQLNTRNFNVLFPIFRPDFVCTLKLNDTEILEYLETEYNVNNQDNLHLKEIYEQTIVPELFNATNTDDDLDIIPDVYINNLGLKIY